MNRREFVAATGLTAAGVSRETVARPTPAGSSKLFRRVSFSADGIDLDPLEYATVLLDTAREGKLEADRYSRGGMVEGIERQFAELLGKPRALFLPTGTLANHLAVRRLATGGRRVLVQAESHLYNDSGDGAAVLSGLNLIPLAPGRSTFSLGEVEAWVERSAAGWVDGKVGVLCVESPVRRMDHAMFDFDELERICGYARGRGIRLHMDGARLFNLPLHSSRTVKEHAALFDTVYVSLKKHFNGSAGAILAGDEDVIEGLFHVRRMFGGSLPHAWPLIGVVPRYVDTYMEEYARAWRVAEELLAGIAPDHRFVVQRVPNGTSRFLLTVAEAAPQRFSDRLSKRGIVLPSPRPGTSTFPMQVNPTLARTTSTALLQAFTEAMQG